MRQCTTHDEFVQQHVVVVATTTASTLLDPSILRPGYAVLLAWMSARRAALTNLVAGTPVATDHQSTEALVAALTDRSEGATIGQLHAIFQEAAMLSLRESIDVTEIRAAALERACCQVVRDACRV
ncbi:hypothetical protein DYB38_003274 [Aphanomyces astaci]|uniref:Uncharacterized protein n=1 Tax=Aphanomyces astaci TaxID=112090 RepID=A0A397DXM0_APHAT|nr:hypothetical protein DYB38_003274 [Aphanomyces astaci]